MDRSATQLAKKFHCPECEYLIVAMGCGKQLGFQSGTEYTELATEWHQRNEKPPTFYMPKSNDKSGGYVSRGMNGKPILIAVPEATDAHIVVTKSRRQTTTWQFFTQN